MSYFVDQTDAGKISSHINTTVFRKLEYLDQANLVEIESFKKRIIIDNLIKIGFLILERSKILLLKFVHVSSTNFYLEMASACWSVISILCM